MSHEVIQDVNGVNWQIYKDANDRWRWESDNKGMKKESKQSFDTKEECEVDAKAKGMGEKNLVGKLGRGPKIGEE